MGWTGKTEREGKGGKTGAYWEGRGRGKGERIEREMEEKEKDTPPAWSFSVNPRSATSLSLVFDLQNEAN